MVRVLQRLVLFFAFGADSTWVVAAEDGPRGASALAEAYECASKGEIDRAMQKVNEAIRVDPTRAEAYTLRGWLWVRKEDTEKALTDFSQAIRLDPKSSEAYGHRARVFISKSLFDEALPDLDKAIELNATDERAYYSRAEAWAGKREHKKAMSDLTSCLRLNPKHLLALLRRGDQYFEIGEMGNSLKDFDEAVRLDSKCRSALVARAGLFVRQGEWDKAIQDCTKAIELTGNCSENSLNENRALADAWFHRAVARLQKEEWEAGSKDLDENLKLAPAHDSHALRAMLYANCPEVKFRDPTKALSHAKKACELSKWNAPYPLEAYAAASAANGDYDAATEWQKKAMENADYVRERGGLSEKLLRLYETMSPFPKSMR